MTSISSPLFSAAQSSFSLSNGFASTVFLQVSQTACMGFMWVTLRPPFEQRKIYLCRRNCGGRWAPAVANISGRNAEILQPARCVLGLGLEPMNDLLSLIVRHGYLAVCLVVFAEAIGVPVPGAVALVAGGAAAASGALNGPALVFFAVIAMLS